MLIKLKVFENNYKCPTLEVEPSNILLVRRELPLGYNLYNLKKIFNEY